MRFEVEVEPFAEQDQVVMPTSTDDEQLYTRYGRFQFTVDGQVAALMIYANAHEFFCRLWMRWQERKHMTLVVILSRNRSMRGRL